MKSLLYLSLFSRLPTSSGASWDVFKRFTQYACIALTCGLLFGTVRVLDSQFELLDEVCTVEVSLLPDVQQPLHLLLTAFISVSARERHRIYVRQDRCMLLNTESICEGVFTWPRVSRHQPGRPQSLWRTQDPFSYCSESRR